MATPRSNVSLLTEGAKYIQRKKRDKKQKEGQVEKVVFDDQARREYLTGFHKRKVAKVEEKRKRAKERDHQDHLAERRRAREELRRLAAENYQNVRLAMGLEEAPTPSYAATQPTGQQTNDGDGENEDADEDEDDEDSDEEEEYEDDSQRAVVTIQEDADDDLGLGPSTFDQFASRAQAATAGPLKSSSSSTPVAKPMKKKAVAKKGPNTMISSDYRSFETKSERKKMREAENLRRKEKMGSAKDRRKSSGGSGNKKMKKGVKGKKRK